GMGEALRRSAQPADRSDRLGRAHPLLRDAQLRPARDGEHGRLPGAYRRLKPAAHRGGPAPRRAGEPRPRPRPGVRGPASPSGRPAIAARDGAQQRAFAPPYRSRRHQVFGPKNLDPYSTIPHTATRAPKATSNTMAPSTMYPPLT